ncbi:hypothetical protein K2173_003706 [Erythroxylum novogranatense]|uniref:Pentatricopeptide repeat-containing protein n=1 Tax=Erythroxylum novogranatense TaxID=1862640 RepID=A0AAV8TC68_9ROSI|nr:hypothetical protein K2173_003706 [Erythroxylum novogranatense]
MVALSPCCSRLKPIIKTLTSLNQFQARFHRSPILYPSFLLSEQPKTEEDDVSGRDPTSPSGLGRRNENRGFKDGDGGTELQVPRRVFIIKPKLPSKTHLLKQHNHLVLSKPIDGRFNYRQSRQYHRNRNPTNYSSPTNKMTNGFGVVCLKPQEDNVGVEENNHHFDDFASDVEKIYRILRKFHSRVPKLELALLDSGVVLRSGLTERVLNRCGDAGNLGYRFFVWVSKQPGYRHSYETYKAMIKILSKMRQFGAVWALIEEMRKDNSILITSEVFIVLLRRFAASRMVDKAIEVLDEMPKYGCEPDEYVFGCLLDALCKNGSVKEAAALFEDMRVRFTPSLKHFTSLLYGWCREGKLMEAKHVLVQMKEAGFEPDIVVYNNLLGGYANAGKMGDAFALLKEMQIKCEPNANSYTIVIQALCQQNRMEDAMRIFVEMERNGCEADIVTYTTLISGFCKWDKIDKGYQILDSMIQKGHMPNQLTYLSIVLAHERKDQLEECIELMREIQKFGCPPDLGIYNVVIRLASKLGEMNEAVQVWKEIEASGFSPGLDSFVILIHGFLGQGCLVEACEYFKEMVGRGLLSTRQYGMLKELSNALLRGGKLEMAKDIWSCMVTKGCDLNVHLWTIWIHALFSNGHVKEASLYSMDMIDAGLMPQPDTFAKLMRGLRKLFNRQLAAEITERVRKMAADRHVTFKMYKRRGERVLKEKEKSKRDGRKKSAHRCRRSGGRGRAGIL